MIALHKEDGIPKVHYQTDQDELLRACGNEMNRLLLGPGDRLIKSAASDVFSRDELLKHRPDDRHFLMHVIAMGDGEIYGENKNGDYWPKSANEKYHPTFVSHGHLFREHRNRGKEQAIGLVKASAYNEAMSRIELLVWGDMEKAAEEYEMAKQGKELSFSMSARLPNDRCSICDHKAKKVSDYCSHLRTQMKQYVPAFKKYAYAINDHPTFFDISRVRKPADRIAHYIEYHFPEEKDRLLKAAAYDGVIINGSEWADFEGVQLPFNEPMWHPTGQMKSMLTKLAAVEQEMRHAIKNNDARVAGMSGVFSEKMDGTGLDAVRAMRPGSFFRKLAREAVLLPLDVFTAYITGRSLQECADDPVVKQAALEILPGLFGKVAGCGCSCGGGMRDMFTADQSLFGDYDSAGSRDEVQQFMDEAVKKFSCKAEPMHRRSMHIIIIKGASEQQWPLLRAGSGKVDSAAEVLADAYAVYKLAALCDMAQFHDDEMIERVLNMTVLQNQTAGV